MTTPPAAITTNCPAACQGEKTPVTTAATPKR